MIAFRPRGSVNSRDVAQEDERPDEVGPGGLQLEHEDDDQGCTGQRERDRPPHPQDSRHRRHGPRRRARAAGPGRTGAAGRCRTPSANRLPAHSGTSVLLPAQKVPDQEVRDHRHGAGQHHRRQHEPEQDVRGPGSGSRRTPNATIAELNVTVIAASIDTSDAVPGPRQHGAMLEQPRIVAPHGPGPE